MLIILILFIAIVVVGAVMILAKDEKDIIEVPEYEWNKVSEMPKKTWGMDSYKNGRLFLGTSTIGEMNELELWQTKPNGIDLSFWQKQGRGETIARIFSSSNSDELFMQTEGDGKSKIRCISHGWEQIFEKKWCLGYMRDNAKYVAVSDYKQKPDIYRRIGNKYDLIAQIPSKVIVWQMIEYKGILYAATCVSDNYKLPNVGGIWKYINGQWKEDIYGIGVVTSLAIRNGTLYCGTGLGTDAVYALSLNAWIQEKKLNGEVFVRTIDGILYAVASREKVEVQAKDDTGWHDLGTFNEYTGAGMICKRGNNLYINCGNKENKTFLIEGTPERLEKVG